MSFMEDMTEFKKAGGAYTKAVGAGTGSDPESYAQALGGLFHSRYDVPKDPITTHLPS